MVQIRPMRPDDLPALAELHLEGRPHSAFETRRARVVFERLWPELFFAGGRDEGPSLVAVDDAGRIRAMLGVALRPFVFCGQRLEAAVSAELYVAPAARPQLPGLRLLREYLRRHPDIAVADLANEDTTSLWLRLGGIVATRYSWNWWRPLSPLRSAFSLAERCLNTSVGRWPLRAFRRLAGSCSGLCTRPGDADRFDFVPLTPQRWAELAEQTLRDLPARPRYERTRCERLWSRLDFLYRDVVRTHAVEVRDRAGEPLGWFLLHETDSGIGRVSQFGAAERCAPGLLAALAAFARQRRLSLLQGVWHPIYEEPLRRFGVLCQPRQRAFLVASRNSGVIDVFRRGEAYWSLPDGEGPLQIWNRPHALFERFSPAGRPGVSPTQSDTWASTESDGSSRHALATSAAVSERPQLGVSVASTEKDHSP